MTPSPASVASKSSKTGSFAASMTEKAFTLTVSPPSPPSSPEAVEHALSASAAVAASATSRGLEVLAHESSLSKHLGSAVNDLTRADY